MSIIGAPLPRVDGEQKVTGEAKYSAEFRVPKLAYAVMAMSTVPSARIVNIDIHDAENASGVIAVLTPDNAPKLPGAESRVAVLQDAQVHYNNQPIAVIVAEELHQAQYAASLLKIQYKEEAAKLDFIAGFPASYPGSHTGIPGDLSFGDVESGLSAAEIKIDQIYTTPIQHHNPMEPHATMAQWDGDHLTIHDATQHISGVQKTLSKSFGIPKENVHVVSWFVGGGFGCKGQIWSHVVLAAMAARQVNRPVKLVLDRPQMFGPVGARPETYQHLTLGATRDGKLTAIRHEVHAHTSMIEDYLESSAFPTRVMYACPNVATIHRLVQLNMGTPTYMRAPGVATGTYAVEVAMDELAYELKMDPLQLRLLNYTDIDPHTKIPFTEKHLRECYTQAAESFGWSKRSHEPRSMRDGAQLIGWGMATETYPGKNLPSGAMVRLQPNGRVLVAAGSQEIGTGMCTIMTQIAADVLGISPELIDARLGDTDYPEAPISAGSMSTASVGPAVQQAAMQARHKLLQLAINDPRSPIHGAAVEGADIKDGKIFLRSAPGKSEAFAASIARNGNQPVEATAQIKPQLNEKEFSCHSFGAIFAEVAVDPDVSMVRTRRIVAVYDVGKVINQKLARSQFIGGIVWGISLALQEDTAVDPRNGRIMNANLADYHVPVNADIGEIDVSAIDIPDPRLDSLGARGIGEIGITGTGAAIANAIFHATGKRVRDLPITPDKLV
ncbi:MAG TPA: xanthine dehydrogenase family protein molybdopterin-binding subunit [Terriglobales bacterium]|jgi:xanthine dehydrogenase YagR molybdenum-binding subunit|nr:xanthine dehydrogenase family protein molybdopterin-binding subunit [Terriglobales bacterium]